MRDLSGQQVKGYVINELIGKGGFAAVYRARQPSVEREVAVKVILPKYANNPDFVRRFETEAQLIARLEHLHIVPLYDFWREPDNAYLVMRWLRGGTLYDSLHAGMAWSLEAIARLLEQVAAALMVAHRNGVIHQDLTPANILFDDDGNAYLADFGIAKDLVEEEKGDGERLVFGSPAYMAPEQITRDPLSPQTDIYSLGIILFQMLTGQIPFDAPTHTTVIRQQVQAPLPPLQSVRSDLPVDLNMIVMRAAAKQPQLRYPDALHMVQDFRNTVQRLSGKEIAPAEMRGEVTPVGTLVFDDTMPQTLDVGPIDLVTLMMEPVNPYKGLRAFDEADAKHFFGRAAVVEQVCQRIAEMSPEARLLAVIGPSGSGKSSVVRAGVLPALRGGAVPGSEHWFVAKMMPGAFPLAELEMALQAVSFDTADAVPALLHDENKGLAAAVAAMLPDDESELVLVIDQFEEVYTQVSWEQERDTFLNVLARAATEPNSRLRIIITLRADFYDRPLLHPAFGALVRQNTEVILPLSPTELRAAIVYPAERAGLEVHGAVVDAVVTDVQAQVGALPLLQYALTELYQRREGVALTLKGYRESGGVLGALARRAEEVYSGLTNDWQKAVKQLFLRLVSFGDQAADTRRRVTLAELFAIEGVERAAMQVVLDEFGRYRLLTFDHDPQTREPTVEVAHEALLSEWTRLHTWLNESRHMLRIQQQLTDATAAWLAADEDASFLVRGARLTQFEELVESKAVALTTQEQLFVTRCVQQRQRNLRLRQAFFAALIVIALFASGMALLALDRQRKAENAEATAIAERDRADEQARVSRSQALAITALMAVDQPDYALLVSAEALHAADTYDARNSLLTVLTTHRRLIRVLHDHTAPVRCVAYSPDGHWFATGDKSGNVLLWDSATHTILATATVTVENDGALVPVTVNSVAFSPDGMLLAVGGADGSVRLWNVAARAWDDRVLTGHERAVWSVTFSPDGTLLASGSADQVIRLWDVATGDAIGEPLAGHGDLVFSVTFSPDGTLLASGSADNTVRLWNVESGEVVGDPLTGHTNWVIDVAFSPDGTLLASGSADNTMRLWNVATGEPVGVPLEGHTNWVRSVAFNADGTLLASGSADGTLQLLDMTTGQVEVLAGHQNPVWGVAFDPAGEWLISAGEDMLVGVWNVLKTSLHRDVLVGHKEDVLGVAFSPDGRWVASSGGKLLGGGQDNVTRVWDVATGKLLVELAGHNDTVSGVAFSPAGHTLATIGNNGTVILWNTTTWEMIGAPLTGQNAVLMSLTFSPDGALLITGGSNGSVAVWDAISGDLLHGPLVAHTGGGVLSMAVSPDGHWLATGGADNTVRLWTLEPFGLQDNVVLVHEDVVSSVVFAPSGPAEGLLVTGCGDAAIRLWDVNTWELVGEPLVGHRQTKHVTALVFNADGTLLFSASQDATIRVWDMAARRVLGEPLVGHTLWISGLAFDAGGILASASWDGRVVLWEASWVAWQTRACEVAHRVLTADEWGRVLPNMAYDPACVGPLAVVAD